MAQTISGNNPEHHFAGAGKPITGGKSAVQTMQDYQLSRFACDLIAQNDNPRKPERNSQPRPRILEKVD